MRTKRRKLFIDRQIQGALVLRATLYWLACLAILVTATLSWRILAAEPRPVVDYCAELLHYCGPALTVAVLLLPVIIWDIVRLSNRFVGPTFRIRRAMQKLANGESVPFIVLRQGDYWQNFADEFNCLARQLEFLRLMNPSIPEKRSPLLEPSDKMKEWAKEMSETI